MKTTCITLSRLAHRELTNRIIVRHPKSQFDPGRVMAKVSLGMIGQAGCHHNWQSENQPERRWHCSQSNGDIVIGSRTVHYCKKCGAREDYLRMLVKDHPDLFPREDMRGRWHTPILWPLLLRRWLTSQFKRLASNESRDTQVVAA
ncbi:MAG: hypothetical protein NTY30_02785 [Candidatus Berkelbacteria bacterium]|nr:hypothetical protein [Candidatus Berkelbacteria bacterium]